MKRSVIQFEGGRSYAFGKFTFGQLRDLKDAEESGDRDALAEVTLAATCAAVARASPGITRQAIEDALDPDEIGELVAAVLAFTTGGKGSDAGEAKSA